MPGFETRDVDDTPEAASPRNARLGLWLFSVYLLVYALFVALSAFAPETLDAVVGGVNLGIIYGFGLIASAFLLALVYAGLCE